MTGYPAFRNTREFSDSTAEQFGIDNTISKKRKAIISVIVAFVIAAVAFSIGAVTRFEKVPKGAIGQADAMTNIHIDGTFSLDISQVILAVGSVAAVIAVLLIIRIIRENRR